MSTEAEAPAGADGAAAAKGGGSKKLLIVLALVGVLAAGGAFAWWRGMLPGSGAPAEGDEAAEAEHAAGSEHGKAEGHGKAESKGKSEGHGESKAASHGGGKSAGPGPLKALDPFIANLSDLEGTRYLKATFQVEFWGDEVPHEFEGRQAQIRDLVLTLLSSKTFDDVRTPDGKQILREEIIARVNQSLAGEVVKNVYFTEFIVQ